MHKSLVIPAEPAPSEGWGKRVSRAMEGVVHIHEGYSLPAGMKCLRFIVNTKIL